MHTHANARHASYQLAISLVLLLWPAPACAEPATQLDRPNILFCLADDWGWPDASAHGQMVVKTPTFDRLSREGVRFINAFVAAPTCTASRAAMLTGRAPHQLGRGANLNGTLQKKFVTFPDLLEAVGYYVGYTRKGWGPGGLEGSGRKRNPAGPEFKDFATFLAQQPADKPFCFWFGSRDPHRVYDEGSGLRSGMNPQVLPPTPLPNTPAVRSDVLDYYFAIQRFDREVGDLIELLEKAGKLQNTIVIMTGDNGRPFPRGKATCYDAGTHVPLAVRWPARIPAGHWVTDYVSLVDLAPTLLQAAGLPVPPEMVGRSFLDVLTAGKSGRVDAKRDRVFTERERHVVSRAGRKSYPIRSLRTDRYHYIRNLRPDLMPAGDEGEQASPIGTLGDVDNSPTKSELIARRAEPRVAQVYQAAFGLRPAEELYDVQADPGDLRNLAGDSEYGERLIQMRDELDKWMLDTGDPRAQGETDLWDN